LLAVAPTVVAAQGVPVQLPPAGCSSLAVSFVEAQGAAGTILDVLQLTNTSSSTCVLNGYVTVQMLDATDAPMPTVSVPGGGIFVGWPGPSSVMLAPGASAPFGLAWSDVPTGAETSCAAAARLAVTPPGAVSALLLDGVSIAPCNGGRINVGPIRPPGSLIPS
ncbi:MAG TPA: DUF4232 domain-containing protein, partial [Chloroflexota bacterium]